MGKTQLKKATITVLKGRQQGTIIGVLFNPTEYSFERTNSYKATPVPGLSSPLLQFVNGECDQLSMELFLDDYTDPGGQLRYYSRRTSPSSNAWKLSRNCSSSTATCTRRLRCVSTGDR
jgi:hypothetical protein